MHLAYMLALAGSAITAASPTTATDFQFGTFHVTKFNYTCPSTTKLCHWDFYVTDPSKFSNHPPITEPLHCTGNSTLKEFTPGSCTDPSNNKNIHINGYIKKGKNGQTHLNLQYVKVPSKPKQFFWFYMGNVTVQPDSATQPQSFLVNETSVVESS